MTTTIPTNVNWCLLLADTILDHDSDILNLYYTIVTLNITNIKVEYSHVFSKDYFAFWQLKYSNPRKFYDE